MSLNPVFLEGVPKLVVLGQHISMFVSTITIPNTKLLKHVKTIKQGFMDTGKSTDTALQINFFLNLFTSFLFFNVTSSCDNQSDYFW